MKFLIKPDHEKIDVYKKKICQKKKIPLITYDENTSIYKINFESMGSTVPEIKLEVSTSELEQVHNKYVNSLPLEYSEISKDLGNEVVWQYWNMLQNYSEFRKDFKYYKEAYSIASELYNSDSGTVIDVGIKDSTVVLDMFSEKFQKYALDNDFPKDFIPPDDIMCMTENLFEYNPENKYDVVLCQQVLEHLDDPKKAFSKLDDLSKNVVVISVPYGSWHNTPHDPINEKKVSEWTGKTPDIEKIVTDFGVQRYVAGYKK